MRRRRETRKLRALAVALALAAAAALLVPALAAGQPDPDYRVGVAKRDINPDRQTGEFKGEPVYLGGYGIGGGSPVFEGRPATGVLGEGIHVRAFAIQGREGSSFAFADIETQGWFVATRDGPYGLVDMRREVEERTNGALSAEQVMIQTNHTHAGPDTIGVWGGVPLEYRAFIAEQTVDAIVQAYETMHPARLFYGTAPGRDLLSNQFDSDPANQAMDSDVRVLQARDEEGETVATLLNFSAHTTVLGSGNTKVSGDWVQAGNPMLEERFGGEAVTIVGTLGRTQPADRGCGDPTLADEDDLNLCKIQDYARRVVERAEDAVANAEPVAGDPVVAARSYLIEDPATNALILGLAVGGEPAGIPINRAVTPPWLTGNVIGTVTATARIGDVLLSAGPGEMYPQIPLKVSELVPAQGYMTAGLANDQLGYLIAPYEAYPEPIRRSFFNERGDEVEPVSNDNYFFNVSHTMGERVTCSLLRGAGEVLGKGSTFRDDYPRCATFANDALLPHGADTRFGSP